MKVDIYVNWVWLPSMIKVTHNQHSHYTKPFGTFPMSKYIVAKQLQNIFLNEKAMYTFHGFSISEK